MFNQKIRVIFLALIILISNFLIINSVKAQPAAISDLQCILAGSPGDVWLTWTPPAGTNSYDVRYWPGFFYPSDYNATIQYSQNWAGTASEGMVSNLTTNTTWYFAMKAIDASNNYSDISNVVSCFVPSVVVPTDKIAPTSLITDPKDGATILANTDYIIKGESSDIGGSVQKVEISFDGKNWFKTKAKESIGTGFTWEYLWEKPTEGTYTIKTRATDWWNNQETPGQGIKVKVIAELAVEKPPVEKPISQMTAEELKAKIVEIQQKIIQLLSQLIQITQEQINQLKK